MRGAAEYDEYDKDGRPLTISHHQATVESLRRRPEHRTAVLAEGVQGMLNGEIETGRGLVQYCIEANMNYTGLSEQTGQPAESLTLMFRNGGSPKLLEFIEAISGIARCEGIELAVNPVRPENAAGPRRPRGRHTRNRPRRTPPPAEYRAREAWADYLSRVS